MAENGFISQEEKQAALDESIWVLAQEKVEKQLYSWYIDEALRESAELLGLSADEVIQGGFRIYTAYDARLQTIADEVYADSSFSLLQLRMERLYKAQWLLSIQTTAPF